MEEVPQYNGCLPLISCLCTESGRIFPFHNQNLTYRQNELHLKFTEVAVKKEDPECSQCIRTHNCNYRSDGMCNYFVW